MAIINDDGSKEFSGSMYFEFNETYENVSINGYVINFQKCSKTPKMINTTKEICLQKTRKTYQAG